MAPTEEPLAFLLLFLPMASSTAGEIAGALNRWAREESDFIGSADGAALDRLIDEYFQEEEEGRDFHGSKPCNLMNYSSIALQKVMTSMI